VTTRAHVWVSGRVQGVFFRQQTSEQARTLGVSGWVLNAPDGRVEAAFEGPEDAVEAMVRWCREGTEWSEIERVDVEREEPEGLDGFEIRSGLS
jgi:acylphosphatase